MEELSRRHQPDAVLQPAQYGSVLEVNQIVQNQEGVDVAIDAIKRPLPALDPGFWSPIHQNLDTNHRRREINRKAGKKYRLKRLPREQLLSRLESQVMKFLHYGGFLRQGHLPRRFDHLDSPLDVISEKIIFVESQLEVLLLMKLRQVGISLDEGLRTEQLEAELLQFWKDR